MATQVDPPSPKRKPGRHRGFLQAGALITEQTRTAAARRGYAEARLKALWPDIVGPEIAGITRPARLTTSRGPSGALLTLGVLGANGPQIQMLLPLIRERINAALGPGMVGRIQITQAGGAEPPVLRDAPPAPPADISTLAAPLSTIGDPELRAALETLACNVLSRSRRNPNRKSDP